MTFRIPILDRIEAKLDILIKGAKVNAQQQTDLIAAVKAVKQASDDEAVRLDRIIAGLDPLKSDPIVAQAITDINSVAAANRAFHADTVIPPVGP